MTPATARTAALTSRVMVSFIGQPDTVRRTVTAHHPRTVHLDGLDHPEVGDRAA